VGRTALLLVVALGALRDPCDTATSASGVNAPCTRTTDCLSGLSCAAGKCTAPDTGALNDGGGDATDTGVSDADAAD